MNSWDEWADREDACPLDEALERMSDDPIWKMEPEEDQPEVEDTADTQEYEHPYGPHYSEADSDTW